MVLRRMYISPLRGGAAGRLAVPVPVKAVLLLATLGTFWLGFVPGSLVKVLADVSARVFP